MGFGDKVKRLREEKNMTQKELADALGVSTRTITNYEVQGRRPRYRKVYEQMAELFGVSVTYLISDEEEDFIRGAKARYGEEGERDAKEIADGVLGLYAGGKLNKQDLKVVIETLQEAYYTAKENEKKNPEKGNENDHA